MIRLIIVVSFIISFTVGAFYMKRESYIDIPTANLTQGLYINVSSSYPIRNIDDVKFDPNFGIDFSYNRFGGALKWYDGVDFSFDFSYRILDGSGNLPGLAVGIGEIAITQYVSPAGSEEVFKDEDYADRPPEVASAYIVGTKKIGKNFEITAGLGRGRFVGYGPRSYIPNSDIFFEENHKNWVIGLFGGMRIILPNKLAFILEDDGRDVNFGIEYQNELVKGTLALNKIELFTAEEWGFSPRISLNLSYKITDMKKEVDENRKFPFTIELIDNKSRELVEGNAVINSLQGDTVGISVNKMLHPFWLKPDRYIAHIKSEGYVDKDIELLVKRKPSSNIYTVELDKKEVPEEIIKAEDSVVIVDNFEDIKNQVEGVSIKFPFKRADLTPRAHRILDRIIELISANEDVYLLIIGHTCSLGSDESNQKLSERRAESVKTYLVGRGIPASKITTEGYGERRPLASNSTEEGRIKNRRAEFILYRMRK